MSLQTVSGQTITEPVTLAALKARIKLTSTADDTQLTGLITAAREFAEHVSHRCLAQRQFMDYRDRLPYPNEPLVIPAPPLVSLDKVEYLDEDYNWQTWDSSEYWVANNNVPAVLQPRKGFTYPATIRAPGCVRVTFTAGGGEFPNRWQTNILDIAVFMYENAGVPVPTTFVQVDKVYIF